MLILNKMYVGGYLTEGENIGHEVINLIKAKDDNYYIWLNAGGNIPEYQVKRMEGKNIDVLLARTYDDALEKEIMFKLFNIVNS